MKRCPECRRDYYDDTLLYCLDDGNALLEGPATSVSEPPASAGGQSGDEPQTAILHSTAAPGEAPNRAQIHMTDQTAVFPRAEAEPQSSGGLTEKQSFSAHRAAKPLIVAVVAIAVLVGGFFGYRYFKPASGGPINSIAVLPFQNKSGDPNSEYLSDGLAESLIYRLTQLPNLKVSPTSAVIRYKGKDTDIAKIASELGVDAVMTGRLAQIGDNLTISVELVDVRNNTLLWGEQYDRKMTDLLATQREIAATITQKLQLKLTGDDAKGIDKKYTDNNEAYQLYLKGRFYGSKRTAKDAQKAIEYYQQAVANDPKYALAYAGLAEANWFSFLYSYPQVLEAVPKARELALKAIELDGSLAEPHSVLGAICNVYEHDFACGLREQKRSIELNPKFWEGHRRYGNLLMNLGRFEEARVATRRALEIDPLAPVTNQQYAWLLFFEKKYDESETLSKKNIELDPNYWYAHLQLYFVYRMKRDYAAAVEELAKAQEARGEPDAAKFIRESFTGGDWPGFLKKITGDRTRLRLYPFFVATFFAELGEKDKAFAALNEALETKDQHIMQVKVDPFMDPLRDDPRFKEVLKKAGFPE